MKNGTHRKRLFSLAPERALLVLLPVLLLFWPQSPAAAPAGDPWVLLQQALAGERELVSSPALARRRRELAAFAAWRQLREVLLPFTLELEEEMGSGCSGRLAAVVEEKLAPFAPLIREAAGLFAIPEAIIKAVIMVESGGDPGARATTTSAAGLMQTIHSTFAAARRGLAAEGIAITADPCDPRASILAGCWYLDRMFARAAADGRNTGIDREHPAAWRKALEYYYAGPGHGRQTANRVLIYRDGKRVVIDKRSYSDKVLAWAGKLASRSAAEPGRREDDGGRS